MIVLLLSICNQRNRQQQVQLQIQGYVAALRMTGFGEVCWIGRFWNLRGELVGVELLVGDWEVFPGVGAEAVAPGVEVVDGEDGEGGFF